MGHDAVSFDNRIKENIKSYTVKHLFAMDVLMEYFSAVFDAYGVEVLLTDRHGETVAAVGDFTGFSPDVVDDPGEKLRICSRTVGHLYARYDNVPAERKDAARRMIKVTMEVLTLLGTEVYMHRESASYMEELEIQIKNEYIQGKYGEKEDILTGVYCKNYLENRMNILDRSETVPIAVINVNINDWKFVYDNFGMEESDSLIQLVASLLMKEAKAEYIIGRIGGDVFLVLIPLAGEGEAEEYCRRVQEACLSYDGSEVLAPSVAVGIVYKTNVENRIKDMISDAEYEMFSNKLEIKNAPGYQERLRRGLADKKN